MGSGEGISFIPIGLVVQQPQCSSSDRSRANSELAVVPYQIRSDRTDLGVGVRTTGSAVLHRLSPTTTLRGLADDDDDAFDFPFLAGNIGSISIVLRCTTGSR